MSTSSLHDRIEEWRKRLLDLSKRNRLINCKIGTRAAIEIVHPAPGEVWKRVVLNGGAMTFVWKRALLDEEETEDDSSRLSLFIAHDEDNGLNAGAADGEAAPKPERSLSPQSEMDRCLASPFLRDTHVLTMMADKTLGTRLNRLSLNARTAISEQGINIFYLAFGLLRWYESESSDVPLVSPLLLVPVKLDRKGPEAPWNISLYEEEVLPNYCLRELLSSSFRIELPEIPEDGLGEFGDRAAYLDAVSGVVRGTAGHSRWEVTDRVILGTFNFQKLAIWRDLGENRERIATHDLCRAIAGDETAPVTANADLPPIQDFDDRIHPKDIRTILDADSSQLEAVMAAKVGMSLIVDGPPGTGKSQTIANIVADSLAEGKTVLFVSEKVAALEVVKRRLDANNLGDFCLECHSHKANKKDVIAELGRCLALPAEEYRDQLEELTRLQTVRQRLNAYVRALHRVVGALNISPFTAHGRLAKLKLRRTSRCPISNVLAVDAAALREIEDSLGSLTACRAVIDEHDHHPWRGCAIATRSLTLQDDIVHDFSYLSQIVTGCADSLTVFSRYGLATPHPTISHADAALREAKKLLEFPELPQGWFTHGPRAIATRLLELESTANRCQDLWIALSAFRRDVGGADFRTILAEAIDSSGLWRRYLNTEPPGTVRTQKASLSALADELADSRRLVADTAEILSKYGLAPAEPSKFDLETALAQARALLEFPDLPGRWFAQNPQKIASQIHELGTATARRQGLAVELSAFTSAIAPTTFDVLVNEASEQSCPLFKKSRSAPPRTLRAQRAWFVTLADDLANAGHTLAEIARAVAKFSEALHVRIGSDTTLKLLSKLTALGRVLMDTGPLKASWFDDKRRAELQEVAARCQRQIEEANRLRGALSQWLNALAFEMEGEAIAAEASQFEPFWARIRRWLTGDWGRFVKKTANLYSQPPQVNSSSLLGHILRDAAGSTDARTSPASPRRLLEDMFQLRLYHSLIRAVRSEENVRAADLIRDENARTRWRDFASGIEAIDRVRAIIRIPERLKEVLTTQGAVDRNALKAATVELEERLRSLETQAASLGERIALNGTGKANGGYTDIAPAALQNLLQEMETVSRQRIEKLDAVVNVLVPDRDVALSDLPSYPPRLNEFCALESRQKALRNELEGIADMSWPLSCGSLDPLVQLARHVTRFLDTYGDSPRDSLLQVVTRRDERLSLESACSRLSSALVEFDRRLGSLAKQVAVEKIGNGTGYARAPANVVQVWLGDAESAVRERIAMLEAAAALLQADRDVAIAELPSNIPRIEEVLRLEDAQKQLCCALKGIVERVPPLPIDPTALTPLVEMARNVARFLDTFGDLPAAGYVEIATQSEARQAVSTACEALARVNDGDAAEAWSTVWKCFPRSNLQRGGIDLGAMPLIDVAVWLNERVQTIDRLQEWIRFREIEERLRTLNVHPLLQEILAGQFAIEEAPLAYQSRFYRLWLDAAYLSDRELRDFRTDEHNNLIAAFRTLDHSAIAGGYKRIRVRLLSDPDRPHVGMLAAPPSSEVGILTREVNKKKRHLALRQLFRRIPTLLPRLKPCMMMSPLAVSTYLDTPHLSFDVVIFDEASQVRPFDAIGAIYRGRQLIVAGDQKQLPPTSFFDHLVSDDDSDVSDDEVDEATADLGYFESVLDVCCSMGMPRKRLRWHYRSRREPLIAFSNRNYYGNELATFPSVHDADGTSAVQFKFVPDGRWQPGTGGGHNLVEARETAACVLQLLETHPDDSLGVITFNQRQQFAVLDEVENLRRERPEMEEYFRDDRTEPLFIKNLENVQGDERDRIIISVGYAHDAQGKFAMRFGPLNVQGGERRLNVAVTRAKEQVILVSSIHANDIDLSRVQSAGARLLRAYLDYAERGVIALERVASEDESREADSPFETAVEDSLRSRGLDVRRQVGCGGYKIDLAIVHPTEKGRYVLGVECDGATYHSSATARDRDRLRQEILESLGWTICRVWSTDWVRNPDAQATRIVEAFEKALRSKADKTYSAPRPSREKQETPILRLRNGDYGEAAPTPSFSSIDEVSASQINDVVLGVLHRYGQTTPEELIKAVARELGFSRVGKRIAARIGRRIKELIAAGKITSSDDQRLSCG